MGQGLRLGLIMSAVCVVYYLGSLAGLALRIPPATTSVLWPPNTILTFALLVMPTRRWLWCLAAALSAHLVVQGGIGWPPPMVVALFGTNSLEAVIAAAGFRWAVGPDPRLDTLRRMLYFMLVVGVVAPILSGFADAAVVWWQQGEPYGVVLRRRVSSNTLTALTLLPALLTITYRVPRWLRQARRTRWVEAGGLAIGLVAAASLAFSPPRFQLGGVPLLLPTPLVVMLPFLLWAAVRFGTAGASLALAFTVFSAVASAITLAQADNPLSAETTILALQVSLTTLVVPLLAFAALIEERYRARTRLAERLAFEALLSRVSASFVESGGVRARQSFVDALEQLGRFLGLDALILVDRTPRRQPQVIATWAAPTLATAVIDAAVREFTTEGTLPDVESAVTLPTSFDPASGEWRVLPLVGGTSVVGALAVATRRAPSVVPQMDRTRLAASVLGEALGRAQADEALRESEGVKAAILAAIPTGVALLAQDARIASVNAQWQAFVHDARVVTVAGADTGSFLDLCRAASHAGLPAADAIRENVEATLAGRRGGYTVEYCAAPTALDRWFTFTAVRLTGAEGGAVLTHSESTERRRAELSAQRTRDELAHVTRVTAMGELAASLAHQLNQPLTGIMTNAQAARRVLAAAPADLKMLDSILVDIVDDDRRAGEVIQRLRDLLRKEGASYVPVDVSAVARDVLTLLASDAVIRNVQLVESLPADPLLVTGDRVQLVQVLLNLALNAMEAMSEVPTESRMLQWSAEAAYGAALVTLRDTGTGLGANAEAVFEPFYTTKAQGLGMGLAIARSIVESHHGRIWAADHPDGGAQFFVSIPLLEGT
jgi:signal transduction histidine kinase/integral membrane sensor domain MASE1